MQTRFDSAYRRLVSAFRRYQDVPRSPDDVAVIGEARWELHQARNAMAGERREVLATRYRAGAGFRKTDVSDEDAARLSVAAISAGFS
jgi:hypothetical protein